ncbi:MAG: ABC transporter ATP-binding protein [Chloroflexi bacterium]|nr:ABC transporter ATP-binding protein [Chloroflexota bacterium]
MIPSPTSELRRVERPALPVALQTTGLTKRFGALVAVHDLSLTVYEGEVFGFLGPNGAGKTTAINLMCGLLKPNAGQIMIHGQPVRSGERAIAARVGICPQDIVLWPDLTCLEQLVFIGQMYGLRASEARQRGEKLLDEMGLGDRRNALARTLSGGMQRRLNLILALVHDPDLIVLDEPEAGLDPQSRVLVRDYIRSLARHKTVILTTHNMDEAERVADRVAIIDHGRLLTLDTPQALKQCYGEGGALEIDLAPGSSDADRGRALDTVRSIAPKTAAPNGTLIVREHRLIELLPKVLDGLKTAGVQVAEVRLRESTLEDVFIALTGRRLRV